MVANTPAWKRISLGSVKWSTMKSPQYAPMLPGVWWQDVTPSTVTQAQIDAVLQGTGGLPALEANNPATMAHLQQLKGLMTKSNQAEGLVSL